MGVFQFVVVGGFPFQGIKGSVKEKRQIEIHPQQWFICSNEKHQIFTKSINAHTSGIILDFALEKIC